MEQIRIEGGRADAEGETPSAAFAPPQLVQSNSLNVMVEGCCHGELDAIYHNIALVEQNQSLKVDLLLCCGDFQAVRTERDLDSMSVPVKYRSLGDFHKYFKGESVAPVLTIFIGGNHEASNYLQELYYGGWVAPNIYFMGFSGCVMFGGLRICGLSGIYKTQDYRRGRHEMPPYDYSSCRSVYHVRELDCFKLAQLSRPVDIAMSHDWPTGIAKHGDTESLLRRKPFFRQEVEEGSLGSPPAEALLNHLKPKFWFSAHLHVKFAAAVHHDQSGTVTRFLALDKCLPRRNFLQLLRIERPPEEAGKPAVLCYDPEWLAIVKKTHGLLCASRQIVTVPQFSERPTINEVQWVVDRLAGNCEIPKNFCALGPAPGRLGNLQTDLLLSCLDLNHVVTIPSSSSDPAAGRHHPSQVPFTDSVQKCSPIGDPNEIQIVNTGTNQGAAMLEENEADHKCSPAGNPNEVHIIAHETGRCGAMQEAQAKVDDPDEIDIEW